MSDFEIIYTPPPPQLPHSCDPKPMAYDLPKGTEGVCKTCFAVWEVRYQDYGDTAGGNEWVPKMRKVPTAHWYSRQKYENVYKRPKNG